MKLPKCLAIAWIVHLTMLFAFAMPYADHLQWSKNHVSERIGVDFSALEALFLSLQTDSPGVGSTDFDYSNWDPFSASTTSRSAWLQEIARHGKSAFSETFFGQLFEWRIALNRQVPISEETHKTLALIALLEDLIREHRLQSGLPASWYVRGTGFSNSSQHHDFAYEDGDILLVAGNSSISALITQATFPQRKFSHAQMLRIRNDQTSTMEALIETGAISRSEAVFDGLTLNAVQVLRWKDPQSRSRKAREASDRAWTFVERRLPYDTAIDLDNPNRLFCSEFVARAYVDGTDIPISCFIPEMAIVRSDPVLAYLRNLGVSNPIMVSPGDLTASPWLEVVAEYRRTDSLVQLWEMMILADVFIEHLERGYILTPPLRLNLLTMGAALGDLALGFPRRIIGVDRSLIPESLNRRALSYIITQEKLFFAKARKQAWQTMADDYSSNLLELKLWELRAAQSFAIQENRSLKRIFKRRN